MPKISTPSAAELRALPARRVVRAIAEAAERWTDPDFPPRVRVVAAIEARLGYTAPVVEFALDRLFGSITSAALEATIVGELGSIEALDGFAARPGRPAAYARGLERVVIISSDTTIGVAAAPLVFALCAKCAVTVKDRFDGLIAAFLATLAEEEPAFARAAEAAAWSGGDAAIEDPLLAQAQCVVAFGGAESLRAVRDRLPVETRFVAFGHRASLGYVAREALSDERTALRWAERAARDLLLYDGESCMSLHALAVERGGAVTAQRFAELLARAVEIAEAEFPPGPLAPERAARRGASRNLAAFREATGRGALLRAGSAAILFDAPRTEAPAFLPRTLALLPVDEPVEIVEYVRAHGLPLEAFATTIPLREDLRAAGVAAGAARLTALGEMQRPPLARNHGGRARIADFIRWIDDETAAC